MEKILVIKEKDGAVSIGVNGFSNLELVGILSIYSHKLRMETIEMMDERDEENKQPTNQNIN